MGNFSSVLRRVYFVQSKRETEEGAYRMGDAEECRPGQIHWNVHIFFQYYSNKTVLCLCIFRKGSSCS